MPADDEGFPDGLPHSFDPAAASWNDCVPDGSRAGLLHHTSREATATDRGRAFGAAHASAIDLTVRTYRRLFRAAADVTPQEMRAAGEAVAGYVGARWPELVDELDAIAAGARQDVRDLMAVNARTELLAGTGRSECSVVGRVLGTQLTLAQTWDWHPDLEPARVVWTVHSPAGAWFTTVTEAGILAKLGVNSGGVACGLNYLSCSADGGVDGVPIHVLLRLLLEGAGDGSTALALLRHARTSASSAITVAAAGSQADLFTVEISPGGGVVIRPDDDGWLVHTNHFLAPPPRGVDVELTLGPGSSRRKAHLDAVLRADVGPREALASHLPAEEPVCRHRHCDVAGRWEDRVATLLGIEIDPRARSLALAAGPPCSTAFEPVAVPVGVPVS